MAYTHVSYLGDGTTTIYSIPFSYIYKQYISVYVDGSLQDMDVDYVWLTDSTIQLSTPPASGVVIFIKRVTPKDVRLVDFQDGNILNESTLDLDSNQLFHIIQESLDAVHYVREVETFENGVDYVAGVTGSLDLINGSNIVPASLTVTMDGVTQHVTEYSVSNEGVITFDSVIPGDVSQVQVSYALPIMGLPPIEVLDGTVSTVKLVDQSVTAEKLANASVTTEKLADDVFSGLTEVVPVGDDYIPISDTSDSGKPKKIAVSTILASTPYATTASPGTVKLATTGEAQAGSSATACVTPSSLAATVLGMGQSYQDVTASRASGVTYTNTTGRTIVVSAWALTGGVTNQWAYAYVNGVMIARNSLYSNGSNYTAHVYFVVPPGATYAVTLDNVIVASKVWYELR